MKLQAGTLLYALAIGLVMGMITASMLINEQYSRLLIHRDVVREEVVRNALSGINYLCVQEADGTTDIDLFGRGKDSVHIECKPWGMYDVLISTAHTGDQSFQRVAMAGSITDSADRYALWLGDMDRALSICGNTELKGTCFLPRAGIERTYIEGSSYSGRQLVYGAVRSSARFVPQYNKERALVLQSLLKSEPTEEDSIVSWNELIGNDTVFCSFTGPVCRIEEKVPLVLSDIFLEGQICIRSAISISVRKSASLSNVILIAPKVIVEDEVIGQFQIVARDCVIIGKKVKLLYPSSVSVCADQFSPLKTAMQVDEETEIAGTLFAVQSDELLQRQLLVAMGKDCILHGDLYCNDLLDLKGKVYGSVTCQKITLSTNSARYENTLLNAVIDNTLYEARPGGGVFQGTKRKEVIAWLD